MYKYYPTSWFHAWQLYTLYIQYKYISIFAYDVFGIFELYQLK